MVYCNWLQFKVVLQVLNKNLSAIIIKHSAPDGLCLILSYNGFLPVDCLTYDDREEKPEGVTPILKETNHPIFKNVPAEWSFFLGYNRVIPKPEAKMLLQFENGDPLLSVLEIGKGRTAAFTSDCAPHWGPKDFLEWKGYPVFWSNLIKWLAKENLK